MGGIDRTPLHRLWIDLLGWKIEETHRVETENVIEDILFPEGGERSVELHLMQPIDPNGSPRVHRPALNHIGLWVDDLRRAVAYLRDRGVRFAGGIRSREDGHDTAFIHPQASDEFPLCGEGVLIELIQAPPRGIDARRW